MKNIFYFLVFTFLVSCNGFEVAPTKDPVLIVSKSEKRINLSSQTLDVRTTGESSNFESSLPSYTNIANVESPLDLENKAVQATSVSHLNNKVFISYNYFGNKISGAIDVVDISNVLIPEILYTYKSMDYEFADIKALEDKLIVVGQKKGTSNKGVILVFDIVDLSNPQLIIEKEINSNYVTSLSVRGNKVLVSYGRSNGGHSLYELTSSDLVLLEKRDELNGLFSEKMIDGNLYLGQNSLTLSTDQSSYILGGDFEAPKRFHRNGLLLGVQGLDKLYLLDLSNHKNSDIKKLSETSLEGTANGLVFTERNAYLAQGENGVQIYSIESILSPVKLGSFHFNQDSGSSNNIFIIEKENENLILIANGLSGLRIIKEDKPNPEVSKEILFYARGDLSNTSDSVVVIKINGVEVSEIVVSKDSLQKVVFTYTRNILPTDIIEIFPKNSNSIYLPWVKVNDRYCSAEETNLGDMGLYSNDQKIIITDSTCQFWDTPSLCAPDTLKIPTETCDLSSNKIGQLSCSIDGNSYFCKDTGLNQCQDGFGLDNNQCLPLICTAGDKQDCSDSSTVKEMTCNSSGTAWGSCQALSCQDGYVLDSGACVPKVCNAGDVQTCSIQDGTGTKTCSTSELEYGSCQVSTCDIGFNVQGNSCVPQLCSPSTTRSCSILNLVGTETCSMDGMSWGTCVTGSTCNEGFYYSFGICLAQTCSPNTTSSCSINNGVGSKTCNPLGSDYGTCEIVSCDSGYHKENSLCVSDVKSCSIPNGLGSQTWDGSSYGSCTVQSCNSGYTQVGQTCEAQICTPNSTSSCSVSNGVGSSTCSMDGLTQSPCEVVSCDSGYNLQGNSCSENVCIPSSTQSCEIDGFAGLKICSSSGDSLSSCTSSGACAIGFYAAGELCLPESCNPNEVQSCSFGDGNTGTKTCNALGSGFSTCVATSCIQGFHLDSGVCTPNICSPDSIAPCSVNNGVGQKTCNSTGSNYGACQVQSCDAGYNLQGGVCVQNVCSPSSVKTCEINGFVGAKVCSSSGDNLSSCVSTGVCASGFYAAGELCLPQVCSPDSNSSCTISNSTAIKTCNSAGSGYGQCEVQSCNAGFYQSGNSCLPQTCSPNSTQSCVENGKVGTITCAGNGSGYGICETTETCASGFYAAGGLCLPQVCSPGSQSSCQSNNGSGLKTCNSEGSSYGHCEIQSCDSGFSLISGSCEAQLCAPSTISSCSIENGTGLKTCSADGMQYGACSVQTCNSGYIQSGNTCVKDLSCNIPNGTGEYEEYSNGIRVLRTSIQGSPNKEEFFIQNNTSSNLNNWALCFNSEKLISSHYGIGEFKTGDRPEYKIRKDGKPSEVKKNTLSPAFGISYTGEYDPDNFTNFTLHAGDKCSKPLLWEEKYCAVQSCEPGYHKDSNNRSCVPNVKSCGSGKIQTWQGSGWSLCKYACPSDKVLLDLNFGGLIIVVLLV